MADARFEDDGGTRAWRANQETWGPRTIDVGPSPSFFARIRAVSLWRMMLFILLWGFLGPFLFAIIAFAALAIWQPKDDTAHAMMIVIPTLVVVLSLFVSSVANKLGYYDRIGK